MLVSCVVYRNGVIGIPTLIAEVYGVKFEAMRELRWRYGYPFSVAIMPSARAAPSQA
jgi:Mg2+ and Co2+ transporter CorA